MTAHSLFKETVKDSAIAVSSGGILGAMMNYGDYLDILTKAFLMLTAMCGFILAFARMFNYFKKKDKEIK